MRCPECGADVAARGGQPSCERRRSPLIVVVPFVLVVLVALGIGVSVLASRSHTSAALQATWTPLGRSGDLPGTCIPELVSWHSVLYGAGAVVVDQSLEKTRSPVVWRFDAAQGWAKVWDKGEISQATQQWLFVERGHLLLLNAYETSTRAWISQNGTVWSEVPVQFVGSLHPVVRAVAQRAGRLVAVVLDETSPPVERLYRSDDGASWVEAAPSMGRATLTSIAAGSSGFAVGGATNDGLPAVWTSPDGVRWSLAVLGSGPGQVSDVAAGGGHLVATGRTGIEPDSTRAAWFTSGSRWRTVALLDGPNEPYLIAASGSFVWFDGNGRTVSSMSSVDGSAWTPVPFRLPPGESVASVCSNATPYQGGLALFAYDAPNPGQLQLPVPWLVKLSRRAIGHTIQDINARLPLSPQPGGSQ